MLDVKHFHQTYDVITNATLKTFRPGSNIVLGFRFGMLIIMVSFSQLSLCTTNNTGYNAQSNVTTAPFDFKGAYTTKLPDTTHNVAGRLDRTKASKRSNGPPNLVLIIADDLGWPYLGVLGDNNVMTPNLDLLGKDGAIFSMGHSSSNICAPTLRTLISGLYPVQYERRASEIAKARIAKVGGIPKTADNSHKLELVKKEYETGAIEHFNTLPRMLKNKGYVSHQSGKWWEQSYQHGGFTDGMTEGWSWQDLVVQGNSGFFTQMGGWGNSIGRTTMKPIDKFLQENAHRPFFLWFAPSLPHSPLNPPYRFYKYFDTRTDLSESAKLYYANIAWFDWSVGQLVDDLEKNGALHNTLIVYLSDNGWDQEADKEYIADYLNLANGGPRGKASFFDTALRTPFVFHWPEKIKPLKDDQHLVNAIDIVPTLLDYAGVAIPKELPGYSLKPVLEGGNINNPRPFMVGRLTNHRSGTNFRGQILNKNDDPMGIKMIGYYRRDSRWHFVWLPSSDEFALYDLQINPRQTIDYSSKSPDLVKLFKADILSWRSMYETE